MAFGLIVQCLYIFPRISDMGWWHFYTSCSRLYILGIHLFRKHASCDHRPLIAAEYVIGLHAMHHVAKRHASFSYSLLDTSFSRRLNNGPAIRHRRERCIPRVIHPAVAICEPVQLSSAAFSGVSWCATTLHSAGDTLDSRWTGENMKIRIFGSRISPFRRW
jgi:hypothetical protein